MLMEFDPKIPADTIPSGAEPCNCKYINNAAGLLEISTWNKSKVSIKLINKLYDSNCSRYQGPLQTL